MERLEKARLELELARDPLERSMLEALLMTLEPSAPLSASAVGGTAAVEDRSSSFGTFNHA
jgi:hypothetical protein